MRYARKRFPGAKYHVTNRGNGREQIFYHDKDRERFLDQVRTGLEKDGVVLYAYCLLSNHYHLLIETPGGNIDRFMGRLGTAYAMYFRYRHYRSGHCFQGRYKAPLVAGDDYIVRRSRYIHLNPICVTGKKKWSVRRKWEYLKEYRWSSLGGYLYGRAEEEFVNYRWLELFDEGDRSRARRAYSRFLQKQISRKDEGLTESFEDGPYAIGSEEFRREVDEWVAGVAERQEWSRDLIQPEEKAVAKKVIEKETAREYDIVGNDIRKAGSRLGDARGMYVELMCTIGHKTQRQTAKGLGVTEHAVGKCRQRFRERLKSDDALASRLEALSKKCEQHA